jgi:quercetin dioxygenase-like cupin family protein
MTGATYDQASQSDDMDEHGPGRSVIVNARTGQRMRFEEPASPEVLRITCWSPATDAREPEHTHPRQESRFELLAGELVFELEGVARTVRAPGDVTIPAGARHRFWNARPEEAHYIQEFRPALEMRAFFELLFHLANEGRLAENGMPDLLDIPAVLDASSDVLRPTSPPWAVLRLTAALLRPFAAIRGRSRPTAR